MTANPSIWIGILIEVGAGIVLGIIGIILIVLYFRNKSKSEASKTWPSVSGQVLDRGVKIDTDYDDDGGSTTTYLPQITYEYQVNGMSYQSHRFAFGSTPGFGNRNKAEAFLAPYAQGGTVKVFYNPEKPEESVLSQQMRSMTAGLVVGIIFAVVMACMFCLAGNGLLKLFQ